MSPKKRPANNLAFTPETQAAPPAPEPRPAAEYATLIQHLATVAEPCVILDWHGHVWEANQAACDLLETSPDRLVDAALLEKVRREDRRQLLDSVREAVMGGQPRPYIGAIQTSAGLIKIQWELAPVASDVRGIGWARGILRKAIGQQDGKRAQPQPETAPPKAVLAELRAITLSEAQLQKQVEEYRQRIVELERQLSSARAAADRTVHRITELQNQLDTRLIDLRASNADIAALGFFSASKLREQVRAASRLIAMLEQQTANTLSPQARAYVVGAVTHFDSLDRLLSSLCAFCDVTRHPVRIEEVDMTCVFKRAAEKLTEQDIAHRCSVHVGNLETCMGDAQLLAIVAEELLSNAIKFSAAVESPVVEVSCARVDGKDSAIAWTVRDNGPGFPTRRARRLFVPMGCVEPQHKGSGAGLGLAKVRRIVQKLGGRVWAESEPGMGASFSFTIGAGSKSQRK